MILSTEQCVLNKAYFPVVDMVATSSLAKLNRNFDIYKYMQIYNIKLLSIVPIPRATHFFALKNPF